MQKKNSEPLIATYLHQKGHKLGLPIGGNFELTARCNFNCPMCYVHLQQEQICARGRELTAAEWLKIAKDARDMGMVFVLLTGGEPLVRKDFFEIYRGMKELGLLISINSNGSLIRGEVLERFLVDPPFRFNISLYGGSNDTYCRMCGLPAYEQVRDNIRALRQAGVDVSLNLSITPYNCEDLERIYADALALDVNVKASAYMYPPVRVDESKVGTGNRLTPQEAAKHTVRWDRLRFSPEEFAQRAQNMKKLVAVEERACSADMAEGVRCRAGSSSFWMTWDGKMLPCGMMPEEGQRPLEVGFEAAWEATRNAACGIRLPLSCAGCTHKEVCSVCAAVCVTETGAYDHVPEYVCRLTQSLVEETWTEYLKEKGHNED